jgi:hypothetical protein
MSALLILILTLFWTFYAPVLFFFPFLSSIRPLLHSPPLCPPVVMTILLL